MAVPSPTTTNAHGVRCFPCAPPSPHSLRMAPFAHPMPICILPPLLCLLLSVQRHRRTPIATQTMVVVTLPLNVSLDIGSIRGTQHNLAAVDTDPGLVTC